MKEATKNAMVRPFIHALGYDIFNPAEVVLEFTADIGTGNGGKVDYTILKDGRPIIMFETRWSGANLNQVHAVVQVFFGRARSSLWRRHAVADVEAAERRAASLAERWHQMNALLRMALALELPLTSHDQEADEGHQRWNRLRALYLGKMDQTG